MRAAVSVDREEAVEVAAEVQAVRPDRVKVAGKVVDKVVGNAEDAVVGKVVGKVAAIAPLRLRLRRPRLRTPQA